MVNTKGIKVFLHDVKAVSPAIATLILIVIAAVAAAGVGILVQSSQKNAQDQTGDKNLNVMGTINTKGSTTVLPVSQGAATEFMKKNPAVTINVAGGGSKVGQLFAYTTTSPTEDVGASSAKWDTKQVTVNGVILPARKDVIIQEAGENAKIYETKIGTGMIVIASQNSAMNIVTVGCAANSSVAGSICFGDLQSAYNGSGEVYTAGGTLLYKVVQRSDKSGTEENFAKWIGSPVTDGQLTWTGNGAQGNQGIRDAIANDVQKIGFVDLGFTGTNLNGNSKVLPATMNGIPANDANKGVDGTYGSMSKTVSGGSNQLAHDLFYYNQGIPTGAIKAYLDWIMTPDGQKIVQTEGFFSN